jgi:IS5 family transposase
MKYFRNVLKNPLEFVKLKVRRITKKTRGFRMRKTRIAQASIFENYSKHEFGAQLRALSNRLDQYPEIRRLVADDLIDASVAKVGRTGLTVENVFRCLLLKQQFQRLGSIKSSGSLD